MSVLACVKGGKKDDREAGVVHSYNLYNMNISEQRRWAEASSTGGTMVEQSVEHPLPTSPFFHLLLNIFRMSGALTESAL